MFIIQLLLPLYTNKGEAIAEFTFETVSTELTEKFGGITSFVRSPAVGLWKENKEKTVRDDIVIYEVMANTLDTVWWQNYREKLCTNFQQQELIIRASAIQLL